MKIWDMLKGGQQLVSLKNHHKTVTCVCMSAQSNRLLTGSLDRCVFVCARLCVFMRSLIMRENSGDSAVTVSVCLSSVGM